ncbi:hypothetical protein SAMN05660337_0727 [Maridesulfovibrio ferrireducens]|uniref:Polysaccharide deacetylase n=1 Tax=Maridesulfovibrio ferrireducens TaxID=246191 RepID=A0A1G9CMK6_9BACT|nr:hypothetical protein [Maridesulfovibrio ferrireducens]SDK52695.1 hypothetical protein SAMN05660337_0727 [Maridesulfovibrio ferrireducens]
MPDLSVPQYCITLDTDWASDVAVEYTIELINGFGIKPTVFATNASEVVSKYASEGKIEVGLHPNFLPNSTHGDDYLTVIDTLFEMFPEANTFRAHAYFENSLISREFYKRGIKYDANLCLYLQEGLTPLRHESGLLRFPTFLEDGVHLFYYKNKCLSDNVKKLFFTDGLKILNFHPTSIFFNIGTLDVYDKYKSLKDITSEHLNLACDGYGAKTLLTETINLIKAKGWDFYSLNELYQNYKHILLNS